MAIFLDFNMPLMDGEETAIQIRKLQKAGQIDSNIKLVLFSGNNIFRENFDKNLFDNFMPKPLDKKLLLKICKQLNLI